MELELKYKIIFDVRYSRGERIVKPKSPKYQDVETIDWANAYSDMGIQKPSAGVPVMHHIAATPGGTEWLVGSAAARFFGLGEVQDLIKRIRRQEMNENYRLFLQTAYDKLKQMDVAAQRNSTGRPRDIRQPVTQGFAKLATFNVLRRRDHMGISVNQNLEIHANCWRCYTQYAFMENLGERRSQNDIDNERDSFEWNKRSATSCAETISNLRAMIQLREMGRLGA